MNLLLICGYWVFLMEHVLNFLRIIRKQGEVKLVIGKLKASQSLDSGSCSSAFSLSQPWIAGPISVVRPEATSSTLFQPASINNIPQPRMQHLMVLLDNSFDTFNESIKGNYGVTRIWLLRVASVGKQRVR